MPYANKKHPSAVDRDRGPWTVTVTVTVTVTELSCRRAPESFFNGPLA